MYSTPPASPMAGAKRPTIYTTPPRCTKRARNVDDEVNTPPKAPNPRRRINWLHLLLKKPSHALLSALDSSSHELCTDVYTMWNVWDPDTWQLQDKERCWMSPVLLASRYAPVDTIQLLIDYGVDFKARNHLGQNALVALVAQPPPSQHNPFINEWNWRTVGFLSEEETHEFYADMGVRPPHYRACDTTKQLADIRAIEMGLIAELLFEAGVDPLTPDVFGKSALDYAGIFAHTRVLESFGALEMRENRVKPPKRVMDTSESEAETAAAPMTPRCVTPVHDSTPGYNSATQMDTCATIADIAHGKRKGSRIKEGFEADPTISLKDEELAI